MPNLSTAERRFGLYKRTLTVPAGLREHEIGASLENGVLRLEMEKEVKKEIK
jgi:HSP20 family molecular chaperone IbpA